MYCICTISISVETRPDDPLASRSDLKFYVFTDSKPISAYPSYFNSVYSQKHGSSYVNKHAKNYSECGSQRSWPSQNYTMTHIIGLSLQTTDLYTPTDSNALSTWLHIRLMLITRWSLQKKQIICTTTGLNYRALTYAY